MTDLLKLVPTVRRISADSVPYGPEIARYRKYLYGAFDGETLIAWAGTAAEARKKYQRERSRRQIQRGRERGSYPY